MASQTVDKSQSLKTVKLINVNGANNNNKYWCCWMLPNWDLYAEYGRVGAKTPLTHTYPNSSQREAEAKLNSLMRDKFKKGYVEASIEDEGEEKLDWNVLGSNAATIEQAIERLDSIGKQIFSRSQINFNKGKGRFESSLGIVSAATIEKARSALSNVERAIRNTQSSQFTEAAENYLKIVQVPTGMKLNLVELLGNRTKIRQQKQVLDLLSEGIKLIASTRQQILDLAAELEGNGRSSWMRWGEAETTDTSHEDSTNLEGERSRFISWS